MIAKLSLLEAHQLGWDDFLLNQNQIEELNYQMQKDIADIGDSLLEGLASREPALYIGEVVVTGFVASPSNIVSDLL